MKCSIFSMQLSLALLIYVPAALADGCPNVVSSTPSTIGFEFASKATTVSLELTADESGLSRVSRLEAENSDHQISGSSGEIIRGEYFSQSLYLSNPSSVVCSEEEEFCEGGSDEDLDYEDFRFTRYWSIDDVDYLLARYGDQLSGVSFGILISAERDSTGSITRVATECLGSISNEDFDVYVNEFENQIDRDSLEGSCNSTYDFSECAVDGSCILPSIGTYSCTMYDIEALQSGGASTSPRATMKEIRRKIKHAVLFENSIQKRKSLKRIRALLVRLDKFTKTSHLIASWKESNQSRALKLVNPSLEGRFSDRKINRKLNILYRLFS